MRSLPVAIVLLAALGAGCGENGVPIFPSYEADVKPLMGARCIRCHGAGGMLNADPDIPPPPTFLLGNVPTNGDFTRLDDANGRFGLLHYTAAGAGTAVVMRTFLKAPMPPPPAPALTDRELEIINRWIDHPAP